MREKERDLLAKSKETFKPYMDALVRWNRRVNLVSTADEKDLWPRHFADSLALLPYLDAPTADAGGGAGFPALVCAIAGAPVEAVIESDGRKCAFLEEIIRMYGLGVRVECARAEAVRKVFPIISCRAFAPLARIFKLTEGMRGPRTRYVLLKGKSAATEIAEAEKSFEFHADMKEKQGGVILVCSDVRPRA
jgi:16S rRNA (guanine527-N7)-methyltransferase